MKILLVDDDFMIREMMEEWLKLQGFAVSTADDGQQAIEAARADKPDVVLMDMSLPLMDGFSATRALKADPQLRQVPVIGLSAYTHPQERQRAMQAGCDDYEPKPVDFKSLVTKLIALVEKSA